MQRGAEGSKYTLYFMAFGLSYIACDHGNRWCLVGSVPTKGGCVERTVVHVKTTTTTTTTTTITTTTTTTTTFVLPSTCPLLTLGAHQERSRKADEELFGSKAVIGHQFLVAKSRDINAPATATSTAGGIEGLLDLAPKKHSSSFSSSMPYSSGSRDETAAAAASASTTNNSKAEKNSGYDCSGSNRTRAESVSSCDHSGDDDRKGERAGGRFRERSEELGESGGLLKRLKPLLDSFIREDAQRTGTLPAADFRRIICEGHGGLWPDLAASSEGKRNFLWECNAGEKPMGRARSGSRRMFSCCYSILRWLDGAGRNGF